MKNNKLQLGPPMNKALAKNKDFVDNNSGMIYIVLIGLFIVCSLGIFLPEALLFALLIGIIWAIVQIWPIIIGTINVIISIFVGIGKIIKFFFRAIVFMFENIRYVIAVIIVIALLFAGCYVDSSYESGNQKISVWDSFN
ncbi:MAG: hypothetical protein KAT32_02080 [Candidatus Moranbacteria bacterium]|nr:hypothetical protein [Candidatus Moranbacteria bacterium]